jgi:hypothetical protein
MFDRIRLWWKFDGKYYHKDFARGVKNLWRWFPTIWKDRDWDHAFIYNMLAKKLEFQAEYIGSRDIHTDAKRDAERMRLVARLIKLQQDDVYGMEYMDYHEQDTNWIDIEDTDLVKLEFIQKSERFDEFFAKYPRQYKRVASGEVNRYNRDFSDKDKQLIAMEIAHENQARCQKLIFNIMHDHIERWWD